LINKEVFDATIIEAIENPKDEQIKTKAGLSILSLAAMVLNHYKFSYNEDWIQSASEKAWKSLKRYEKKKGSAFNYLWTIIHNDLLRERHKAYKQNKFIPETCFNKSPLCSLEYTMFCEEEKDIHIDLDINFVEYHEDEIEMIRKAHKIINSLTFSNGRRIPNYIWDALIYLQENKVSTLDELVKHFGWGNDAHNNMKRNLLKINDDRQLNIEVVRKNGSLIFHADNLNLLEV